MTAKAALAAVLMTVAAQAQAVCWQEAGAEFGIQPALLYAIAEQESSLNPRAIGHNRDGSRDIGIMQINSYHLSRLAQQRITEKSMLADSCQSIKVGAAILADFMRRYGYSWEAVGAYNAGTADTRDAKRRRRDYAAKVAARYQRLFKAASGGSARAEVPRAMSIPIPAAVGRNAQNAIGNATSGTTPGVTSTPTAAQSLRSQPRLF